MVFYPNRLRPVQQLRDDLERLLTGVLGPWAEAGLPGVVRGQPAANMWEQADALIVEMEVPGVKGEQLDISVLGNELTVRLRRPEEPEKGATYHRRERPLGPSTRVLRLPVEVDADRVAAELNDGVLTITLPKAEGARPRKIQVAAPS